MQNLELTLAGAVDPYFRADANLIFQIDEEGESLVEVEEAYLTTLTLRQGKVTMDGQATLASDLITTLEKSKRFKQVQFSSPTTRAGDKERFALSAEVAR